MDVVVTVHVRGPADQSLVENNPGNYPEMWNEAVDTVGPENGLGMPNTFNFNQNLGNYRTIPDYICRKLKIAIRGENFPERTCIRSNDYPEFPVHLGIIIARYD